MMCVSVVAITQIEREENTMDLQIDSRNVTMTPRWKTEIESRMADLQAGDTDKKRPSQKI